MNTIVSKGITSFSIFQELLTTLTPTLRDIVAFEKEQKIPDYNFIFKKIKKDLINAIGFLAKGYNNFKTSN